MADASNNINRIIMMKKNSLQLSFCRNNMYGSTSTIEML